MGFGAARKDAGGRHRAVASEEKGSESDGRRRGSAGKNYGEPPCFRYARIVAEEAGQRQTDFGKQFRQRSYGKFQRLFAVAVEVLSLRRHTRSEVPAKSMTPLGGSGRFWGRLENPPVKWKIFRVSAKSSTILEDFPFC